MSIYTNAVIARSRHDFVAIHIFQSRLKLLKDSAFFIFALNFMKLFFWIHTFKNIDVFNGLLRQP